MNIRHLLLSLMMIGHWYVAPTGVLRYAPSMFKSFLSVCVTMVPCVFISSVNMGTRRIGPIIILCYLAFNLVFMGVLVATLSTISVAATVVLGVALSTTLGLWALLSLVK